MSGTTQNTALPNTKTPVGHDIKHGTPKPTAAHNTDQSAATEKTTTRADGPCDPSTRVKSATSRVSARQNARKIPTVKEQTTGAEISARQEAGQKQTNKDGATNRAAEKHQSEREQAPSSKLHMTLTFLRENAGHKLANHIWQKVQTGAAHKVSAQL